MKPIKYIIDHIAPVLNYRFNLAVRTSTFSNLKQVSEITVLHKGGDINNLTSYRPISILPVFSKAPKQIIHKILTNCLDNLPVPPTPNMVFGRKGVLKLPYENKKSSSLPPLKKLLTKDVHAAHKEPHMSMNRRQYLVSSKPT